MIALAASKVLVVAVVAGLSGLAITSSIDHRQDAAPAYETVPVKMPGESVLSVGRFEVSFAQWKACHDDGGCKYLPHPGVTPLPGPLPAIGVNHLDVRQYIAWINRRTGKHYRLPSAVEWQAIAAEIPRTSNPKLFSDPRLAWAADYGSMPAVDPTMKVAGAFGYTTAGVADLSGNVWEWTATCSSQGFDEAACPAYRIEGAHETTLSIFIRNPAEGGCAVGAPPAHVGFRLVGEEE